MSVIWYKAWYDLWHNKVRTTLAVVSIAAGVFSIGAMFGMGDQLLSGIDRAQQAGNPPHVDIVMNSHIDRDAALALKNVKGVEGMQPYNQIVVRYKVHPHDSWKQGVILMLDDYDKQKYQLIQLKDGRWPRKDDIGIERMAAQFLHLGIGDTVIFDIENTERALPISGKIRYPLAPPPEIFDRVFFFVDAEGLERFNIPQGKFNAVSATWLAAYGRDGARDADRTGGVPRLRTVGPAQLHSRTLGQHATQTVRYNNDHWHVGCNALPSRNVYQAARGSSTRRTCGACGTCSLTIVNQTKNRKE